MQVTEHIHAIKIPFKLQVSPGVTLGRFVYAYLIYGKKICLIDCGVASSDKLIIDYLKKTGRSPEEISLLVLTHSHADHTGGGLGVKRATGCKVAAHKEDKIWIEDVDLQYKERPVLNFYSLMEGSLRIDLELKDGDRVHLEEGKTLRIIHTPGHSKGSISLVLEEEGALFSGDAIPLPGGVPIYDDVLDSIRSVRKLKETKGLKVLFASWDEPRKENLYGLMEQGLRYFQDIHEAVREEKLNSPSSDLMDLNSRILKRLGLPANAMIPIVTRSLEAHLKLTDVKDLLA